MPQLDTPLAAARPPYPAIWTLPPLILHPFTGEKGPDRLLEGSKAQLAIHGLVPLMNADRDEMHRMVMDGRYQELKMLIYIGRDLRRWSEQCLDFVNRDSQLRNAGLKEQSFVMMLVNRPPEKFTAKLKQWGITDQRSIFTRAIGLNSVFDQPPEVECLTQTFLQSYQRFADYLFICYQTMVQYKELDAARFPFELYASEEYSRLLEEGWKS